MDIHLWIFIVYGYRLRNVLAWILMWISTLVWIIEDCHPKIMNIHVDICGFLEIHAWICYGFSDQGNVRPGDFRLGSACLGYHRRRSDYSHAAPFKVYYVAYRAFKTPPI